MKDRNTPRQESLSYTLPSHTLTGTANEVVAQLDDVIGGLLGLRTLIVTQNANALSPAHKRRLRLVWPGAALLLLVLLFAASAAAQSPEPEPAPAATAAQTPSTNPFDGIQLGVTFEGYSQYNWNRPFDRVNLLRAYDTRANVFGIQQTAIVVEGTEG
jgi:hypothetical protein